MGSFGNALRGGSGNTQTPAPNSVDKNEKLERIRAALQKEGAIVTGIGSRETPPADMRLLTEIGRKVEERGMRGRSGGAGGADLAFEKGFSDPKNIDVIFPWPNFLPKDMTEEDVTAFLGRQRPKSGPGAPVMLQGKFVSEAQALASKYHPAWDKCSYGAKKLHSRNMPQVLGIELNRQTDVIIAWTVDGKATGGTGQALRIGADLNIPIANLKNPDERKVVLEVLGIPDPAIEMQKARMHQQQMGR